jgi:hypothetical protein
VSKHAFSYDLFDRLVSTGVESISDVEEPVKQIPLSPNGVMMMMASREDFLIIMGSEPQ